MTKAMEEARTLAREAEELLVSAIAASRNKGADVGVSIIATALAARDAEIERLRMALTEIEQFLDGEPEYHSQGMGCGLEDRCITDRYEAMEHGWGQAMERVYAEHINHALEITRRARTAGGQHG